MNTTASIVKAWGSPRASESPPASAGSQGSATKQGLAPTKQGGLPHEELSAPFLSELHQDSMNRRWHEIQARFVDDPRAAVADANTLVNDLTDQLVRCASEERKRLEGTWNNGSTVSTEDLRLCLRSYRRFFRRLLPTARSVTP